MCCALVPMKEDVPPPHLQLHIQAQGTRGHRLAELAQLSVPQCKEHSHLFHKHEEGLRSILLNHWRYRLSAVSIM